MDDVTHFALKLAAAGLLALTAGQAAAAPPKAPKACFSARSVTNFSAVDDRTVNIRVGVRDVYQLDLFGFCPDIDWQNEIAIKSRGSSFICSPLDATILVRGPFDRIERCEVRGMRKLTEAEIAALPPRHKP